MSKIKTAYLLLLCATLTLCTFLLKYYFPERFFIAGGYLLVILITAFIQGRGYTLLFGAIGAILMVAGVYFPDSAVSWQWLIGETVISVFLLVLAVFFVLYIKKLYSSMELEQRQVRSMFEYATEGIVLTDKKGNIILINPAALKLFQYTREELIGTPIETLIPARFHAKHKQYRESFRRSPSNRTMGVGRDLFARTKNGNEFPVEVSLSYYRNRNEFYVIAFLVDITQRKLAEKQTLEQKEQLEKVTDYIRKLNADLEEKVEERTLILKEALEELEDSKKSLSEALDKEKELNEIKSRFVSMASHEFRTPLSTVLSSAALISKYDKETEQDKREKHVRRIRESVKHLNDLLEDFLSLGKLEEGKVEASGELLMIGEFIREIAEDMSGACKAGQTIDVDYSGDGSFRTDKKLLRNILFNLISNAIKFSPEESAIWLRANDNDRLLHIEVQDKGIGIPGQDMGHMFTSFYRGSNALNIQGTGLGLHIVKRYVDLLKGEISIKSDLGNGTTVTLEIPDL